MPISPWICPLCVSSTHRICDPRQWNGTGNESRLDFLLWLFNSLLWCSSFTRVTVFFNSWIFVNEESDDRPRTGHLRVLIISSFRWYYAINRDVHRREEANPDDDRSTARFPPPREAWYRPGKIGIWFLVKMCTLVMTRVNLLWWCWLVV